MADTSPSVPGFFDGFGDRLVVTDRTGRALEVLRLRPELVADPRFEEAVRARAAQLTEFQHAGCTHVRHVGRLPGGDGRLALVSDFVTGWRLSEVLQAAEQLDLTLHTNAVLFLLRQLVSVVAQLHSLGADVCHGALGPERIVVTPTGRLVVMEHVLGSGLPFIPSISAQRAWRDLRLAVPGDEAHPFGQRTDILQVGLCGLALVLSRPLRLDDYPQRLRELLDRATESKLTGERRPLRQPLRAWFEHMLGLVPGPAAASAHDAREGLDRLVSREGYLATPTGLVSLLESVEAYFAGELVAPVTTPEAPEPRGEDAESRVPAREEHVRTAAPAVDEAPEAVPATVHPMDGAIVEEPVSPTAAPEPARPAWPGKALIVETPAPIPVLTSAPIDAPAPPPTPVAAPPFQSEVSAPAIDPEAMDLAPGPRPAWPAEPALADEGVSFAPEPGFAFTPEEDESLEASAGGQPPATDAHAATAQAPAGYVPPWQRSAAPSGPHDTTIRVKRPPSSGAVEAVPPPPPLPVVPRSSGPVDVSPTDEAVGPIAAPLSEGEDGVVTHARPAAHRLHSGAAPRGGAMFGVAHEDDEDDSVAAAAKPSNMRWIAAAAVGCVALIGMAGGWALMGTSAKEAGDRPPAAQQDTGVPSRDADPGVGRDTPAARPPAPVTPAAPAASPAVPPEAPPVPMGELRVVAPFPVEVFESGVKLGTSQAPIQLTAGRHRLEVVNGDLQFRAVESVDVRASGRVRVQPAIPQGTANINATPWADVWIDGERAGETPLGNVALPIGSHQIVFKHPQLGEQTRTLVVTATAPARLSVEMKQ